jgi:AcrR family transcriptional regulator
MGLKVTVHDEAKTTRERLVEVARDLFHRHGYHKTGVAQILKTAGVRSGSLYYFFPSKENLLQAVLERYKESLWPIVMQPVFDRIADPIERVFGVLAVYREALMTTEFTFGCPIGNLALELNEVDPQTRMKIVENFDGWRLAIRGCLDAAADRLPPDVDCDRLAGFVLTVMEGGVMQSRSYCGIEPFDAAVAQLGDYFGRLLSKPAARVD